MYHYDKLSKLILDKDNVSFFCFVSFVLQSLIHHRHHASEYQYDTKTISFQPKIETSTPLKILNLAQMYGANDKLQVEENEGGGGERR